MAKASSGLHRIIAVARILTSVFFLLFGHYKVFRAGFAHGGFQQYLEGFIQSSAVGFYRGILQGIVLPHATFFGYFVGVIELAIGISLLLGWYVRPISVIGALHMISLTLATWWSPGHNVPVWRYFGAQLDHLPLLFLFAIFFSARAGETWGIDGFR